MALTVYATPTDLTAWDGTIVQPANVLAQLRAASLLVSKAINEDPYNTVVVDSPRTDATCAQAAAWIAGGIDPTSAVVNSAAPIKSKAVDGASIDYDTSASSSVTAYTARNDAAKALAPTAYSILYAAGLLYADLPQWSADPDPGVYVDELGRIGGYNWWPYA